MTHDSNWDEARGSYVDHIVDGERRPEMSQVEIDSPVPVVVDLPGQAPRRRPKGKHIVRA